MVDPIEQLERAITKTVRDEVARAIADLRGSYQEKRFADAKAADAGETPARADSVSPPLGISEAADTPPEYCPTCGHRLSTDGC